MPIRDLLCRSCGNQFEDLVFAHSMPECSQCGSINLDRLVSAPAAYYRDASAHKESERRENKRERVSDMIDKQVKEK